MTGFLRSKQSLPTLLKVLREHNNVEIRATAAYALGWLQDNRAIEPLIKILNDQNEDVNVRSQSAASLEVNVDPRSVKSLISALQDSHVEVRFWAAYALGQIGDKRAIPHLIQSAKQDHAVLHGWWEVSKEASDSITRINSWDK